MSYLDFDYSSGSGDLNPTLGEEACAPLWFKTSVLLPLLNFWQCYNVLVNVVTKSQVCPQLDLATMPTTKSSLSPRMKECFLSVIQHQVCLFDSNIFVHNLGQTSAFVLFAILFESSGHCRPVVRPIVSVANQ